MNPPECHGQGIGEQLLAACIAKARTKGITRIELETRIDNERAIGLYRKLGLPALLRAVTALMIAARTGRVEIVKLLVAGGADLYAESHWRDGSHARSAFDHAVDNAVETGRIGAVEYLWTRQVRQRCPPGPVSSGRLPKMRLGLE